MSQVLQNVREYVEENPVEIDIEESNGRLVIVAFNEAKYNSTVVDLLDLIAWLKANKPELLK